jgi:hypothetical protein
MLKTLFPFLALVAAADRHSVENTARGWFQSDLDHVREESPLRF